MRQNIRRTSVILCLISFFLGILAQAPQGYYQGSKGKSGAALKTALYGIIGEHTERSYKELWEDFGQTDLRKDGKIWDMYSNITNYVWRKDQAGQYRGEGDVYNREHSFPKSWFNDQHPMYTDLFHLYPTDGYVNSMRSNYPFGETNNPTKQSANSFSKLGPCSVPGYTGTVFEPNDEYKGDFARTYFYMATAYEGRFASFKSPMLDNSKYPCYKKWALDMLLRWAKEDPVSEKEIKRNNAVYKIQKNRNPYIDFPGLEQYVWGEKTSTAFDPDNYDPNGGGVDPNPQPNPNPTVVATPTFNPQSGIVPAGTEVTISCTTQGAQIVYRINEGNEITGNAPVKLTIQEDTRLSAYAVSGEKRSESVTANYQIQQDVPTGTNIFMLVTDQNNLQPGQNILIVCTKENVAMCQLSKDYRLSTDVTIKDNTSISTDINQDHLPYAFILGQQNQNWSIQDPVTNKYLSLNNDNNKLHVADNAEGLNAQWEISISGEGMAQIQNANLSQRSIQYNRSSPRFACYKNQTQTAISIFAKMTSSGITAIENDSNGIITVYNLNGRLLRRDSNIHDALHNLPRGIYIVNGQKILIR